MDYRPLGKTGLMVSSVSFGAGPVANLMTRKSARDLQRETVARAVALGVNWFDTAATYGEGTSETSLGAALCELGLAERVHVGGKARIPAERLSDIAGFVHETVAGSLQRLRLPRLTLLQLHNSVTDRREDLPTSITPADVLGPGGVLEAFEALRREGLVAHFGLTGLGHRPALERVIGSGAFATIQVPFHLLAGAGAAPDPAGGAGFATDELIACAAREGMGVFAIRVFAGGALTGRPPSEHTRTTRFFPLALYESDRRRAAELERRLPAGRSLGELALRFVLSRPEVSSALIGFADPAQVEEAVRWSECGPLSQAERAWLDIAADV